MSGQWGFTTSRPTDARYGDDVAKYAMSHGEPGLKTFVREVLQNSNDARLDNDQPARVTFKLESLQGDEAIEYLRALDIETWSEHANLATDTESGKHIAEAIKRIKDDEKIRILTIEDENTEGLLGEENADESNFTALVRDVLFSSKSGDTAGGSYGLGKAVLWLYSGLSLVMFNSTLSEPDPKDKSPRLIGRTRLPTHKSEDGDTVYQGHGWYGGLNGNEEGARPESIWGEEAEAIADGLQLGRPDGPGTSIQVVDFRVPTAEERLDNEELADQITEMAIEWFWPAIYRGDLEVAVKVEGETKQASIDEYPQYEPFTSCLDDRANSVSQLDEPGDVAQAAISLDVPEKSDGSSGADGQLDLLVRRADTSEYQHQNEVAFVRGSGMVVEYYDRNRVVVGNQDFHAVLLGGRARPWGTDESPRDADTIVEEFLTAAEPPQHDEWVRTETLANTYSRGFRTAVEGIKSDVTETLRGLVAPDVDRGATGPQRLGNRFKIGNESRSGRSDRESPSSQRVTGNTNISFDEVYTHWSFNGEVEPLSDRNEIRAVTVSLVRMAEERATSDRLPVQNISSDTAGVSISLPEQKGVQVGRLEPAPGTSKISFEGISTEDHRQVETRLKVSVDVAERRDE
ncbi:hypothetical protein HTZ84_11985 [Haloterrigena sp. SYSU A558-1]|uniref:ATP-binding protein n=1 Tax=Haloterrigena gelatinilytica TaxID=2741724 RepID=A0ABX2LHE4_9EURY|nr:hypothetical protein [Haloterrigena gelatinilytica]NUC73022.1 hypothetical protein [Haloterrigena gelatinilytica]